MNYITRFIKVYHIIIYTHKARSHIFLTRLFRKYKKRVAS
ncbi:hypothetical protein HMPREF0080_00703 [Anaeroglobus geminatus F0357]|uniref:Uncharacterized protein n=1 Tax=Anaeroglobus geminatus F0357 TaxID=861450 RepID=G9YGD9_9FIRM|nr:hypothetical protein HMPREF0080_00703 [Anaeroglobus geminatus F0357]